MRKGVQIGSMPEKMAVLYKAITRKKILAALIDDGGKMLLSPAALGKYRNGSSFPTKESLRTLAKAVGLKEKDFHLTLSQFIERVANVHQLHNNFFSDMDITLSSDSFRGDQFLFQKSIQDHNEVKNVTRRYDLFRGHYYLFHNVLDGDERKVVRALFSVVAKSGPFINVEAVWKLRGVRIQYTGVMYRMGDKTYISLEEENGNEIVHMITHNPANMYSPHGTFFHGVLIAGDDSGYWSKPAASKVIIAKCGEIGAASREELLGCIGTFGVDKLREDPFPVFGADEREDPRPPLKVLNFIDAEEEVCVLRAGPDDLKKQP